MIIEQIQKINKKHSIDHSWKLRIKAVDFFSPAALHCNINDGGVWRCGPDDYDSQSDHTFFYIDYLGSRNEVCAR